MNKTLNVLIEVVHSLSSCPSQGQDAVRYMISTRAAVWPVFSCRNLEAIRSITAARVQRIQIDAIF